MEGITHIPKRCPDYFFKLLNFDFIDCLMEKYSICNNLGHYQSKHYEITLVHSYSLRHSNGTKNVVKANMFWKILTKQKNKIKFDIRIWGCHELCFFFGKRNHFDFKIKNLNIQFFFEKMMLFHHISNKNKNKYFFTIGSNKQVNYKIIPKSLYLISYIWLIFFLDDFQLVTSQN